MSSINITSLSAISTSTGTLLYGTLNTIPSKSEKIKIDSGIGNDISSSIVVSSRYDYEQVKILIQAAPVTKQEITIYDHRLFPICQYATDRESNVSGTVSFSADSAIYMKNIAIPAIDRSSYNEIIIPITDYRALSSVHLKSNKKKLVESDVTEWLSTFGDKNIHIFTTEYIYDYIKPVYMDKASAHCKISVVSNVLGAMVEYICGPTVSEPIEKFQGFLDFSSYAGLDVLYAACKNVEESYITVTARTKGRVHIFGSGSCTFSIILSPTFEHDTVLKFCESVTSTFFGVTVTNTEPECRLYTQVYKYINVVKFHLALSTRISDQLAIIMANPKETMTYLFSDMSGDITEDKDSYMKFLSDDFFKNVSLVQSILKNNIVLTPQSFPLPFEHTGRQVSKYPTTRPPVMHSVTCASPV
jgi:hypothetical protein